MDDVFYETKGDGTVQTADALKNICDILADRTNAPTSSQLNNQGYIVIKIACPVEVTIEKNGEVLKSDKDDMVLNIDEDGDGKNDYELEPGVCEGNGHVTEQISTKVKYSTNTYDVEYEVVAQYGNNYNTNITIINTSDKKIHNWKLAYNTIDDIEIIWNGSFEDSDGCTVITNVGYNQDITLGECVSFGFIAMKNRELALPDRFMIITQKGNVDTLDYEVKFEKTSDWGSGYNGAITITNTSDHAINDWTVSNCKTGNGPSNYNVYTVN